MKFLQGGGKVGCNNSVTVTRPASQPASIWSACLPLDQSLTVPNGRLRLFIIRDFPPSARTRVCGGNAQPAAAGRREGKERVKTNIVTGENIEKNPRRLHYHWIINRSLHATPSMSRDFNTGTRSRQRVFEKFL